MHSEDPSKTLLEALPIGSTHAIYVVELDTADFVGMCTLKPAELFSATKNGTFILDEALQASGSSSAYVGHAKEHKANMSVPIKQAAMEQMDKVVGSNDRSRSQHRDL